jgi:hypothetical protein
LNSENERPGSSEPEEDLHELLAAAEKRKSTEIEHHAKSFKLIIGIPVGLLLIAFAIFMLTEEPAPVKSADENPTNAAIAAQINNKREEKTQFDQLIDGENQTQKTNVLGLKEDSGHGIDKKDIHFAMELLNFMQSPEAAKKNHK